MRKTYRKKIIILHKKEKKITFSLFLWSLSHGLPFAYPSAPQVVITSTPDLREKGGKEVCSPALHTSPRKNPGNSQPSDKPSQNLIIMEHKNWCFILVTTAWLDNRNVSCSRYLRAYWAVAVPASKGDFAIVGDTCSEVWIATLTSFCSSGMYCSYMENITVDEFVCLGLQIKILFIGTYCEHVSLL